MYTKKIIEDTKMIPKKIIDNFSAKGRSTNSASLRTCSIEVRFIPIQQNRSALEKYITKEDIRFGRRGNFIRIIKYSFNPKGR